MIGADLPDDDLLASALMGGGLPEAARHHIWQAGYLYHLDDVAETHLREAEALAPGHEAVLIGLYRFYFYKGRLHEALDIARRCLTKAAANKNFPPDWRQTKPTDAAFGTYDDMMARFFLFTLKGYAYLQMRLGYLEEGRMAVMKLLELDPTDKIGAKLLLEILERSGQDDD